MSRRRAGFAGERNQRITVQARAAGRDGLGEANAAWVDLPGMPVWAKAQPLRGRELLAASQMQAVTDVRITLCYRVDVNTTHRVLWKGQAYDVASAINVDGASQDLELMCISGVRDGQ